MIPHVDEIRLSLSFSFFLLPTTFDLTPLNMGVSRSSCAEMWGIEENSRGWRIWLIFAVFRESTPRFSELISRGVIQGD